MICVLCRKRDVRPPSVCDKCGRLVCDNCRKIEYEALPGFKMPKAPTKSVRVCTFCLAERELST